MRAHARFVGILMAIVLLVAVVAAAGPVTYIVTVDEYGNSYYLDVKDDGTLLGPQTPVGTIDTYYNHGAGIGEFTNDEYYDFVVGSGYTDGPAKEIYLWSRSNNGNAFLGPNQVGSWSTAGGDLPGEMAVAKFSGKVFDVGVRDEFVMVRWGSPNAGLYRWDATEGKFVETVLEGVAPQYSYGADAADINHDGYADFVVAPVEGDPQIYVNLKNEEGTFTTKPFYTYGYPDYPTYYTGITAADFDGDHMVDLIATVAGSGGLGLDFYKGDGLGGFTWRDRINSGVLSGESPIDNYDLDNDGDQDLVASNLYNIDSSGVIVGLNDGSGYFGFDKIYYGDQIGVHTVIAAPPVFPNQPPEADLKITYEGGSSFDPATKIPLGTRLIFSSAESNDPEGKEFTIQWEFSDGNTINDAGEHQFNTPGPIDVTLTVTDNYDVAVPVPVTINVNYPPQANAVQYATSKNTLLTVDAAAGLLAPTSVTDADNDPVLTQTLTVAVVDGKGPTDGTLSLNPETGAFTYEPNQDDIGPDSFTYVVSDGLNDSNEATVTINVNENPEWKVNIIPNIINLRSNGMFIAFITVPKPYSVNNLQPGSVECEGIQPVRIIRHTRFSRVFGAVFRTADLQQKVKIGPKVELTVTGTINHNGEDVVFSGSDKVRLFSLKSKIKDDTENYWSLSDEHMSDKFRQNPDDNKDKDNSGHNDHDQEYGR